MQLYSLSYHSSVFIQNDFYAYCSEAASSFYRQHISIKAVMI